MAAQEEIVRFLVQIFLHGCGLSWLQYYIFINELHDGVEGSLVKFSDVAVWLVCYRTGLQMKMVPGTLDIVLKNGSH